MATGPRGGAVAPTGSPATQLAEPDSNGKSDEQFLDDLSAANRFKAFLIASAVDVPGDVSKGIAELVSAFDVDLRQHESGHYFPLRASVTRAMPSNGLAQERWFWTCNALAPTIAMGLSGPLDNVVASIVASEFPPSAREAGEGNLVESVKLRLSNLLNAAELESLRNAELRVQWFNLIENFILHRIAGRSWWLLVFLKFLRPWMWYQLRARVRKIRPLT